MATNGDIPAGDTEMAECDGEVVTMMDVLKEQQDFEDDANAVLGGSDEKECTYSQGYIKRQAIYACMTCCPESKDDPSKRAGFCLACSLTCHENHDLVELYTKRNFRCDCGNPKFKIPCQFTPNKPELNEENVYNQNFEGLYCICSKPYGDQDSTLDDEMIQCIICEDWWHATHLDAVVPANDQYSEMICKLCMAKNEFLHDYSDLTVNVETEDVDVIKVNGADSNTGSDDKLSNGSLTDEKVVNGVATEKTLNNGIQEGSTSNDMDTSTTEAPNKATSENESEGSSTEQDNTETENKFEKPVESEENKSAAPMATDEIDKAAKVLPEVCSETTSEATIDKTEGSEPSDDKPEELTSKEKAEQPSSTSEEKTEGSDDPTEEGKDKSIVSADKTTEVVEEKADNAEPTETAEKSESTKENNSSAQAESEKLSDKASESTEKSEDMDIESKVTENDETNAKEEESAEAESSSAEIDKLSADANNDKPSEGNNSDKTEPAETSQDKDMNEINKGKVTEDTNKIDKLVNGDSEENDSTKIECKNNDNVVPEVSSTENKRKIDDVTDNISVKKPKLDESKCLRPKGVKKVHKGATFWPSMFRQKLCTCNVCISMYKDLSVLFLTDLEDTVFAYETLGKERTAGKPNQYEKGLEALCSLGRIQQIDALTEYNKMRDKLLTFLQSFKDKKEIVTENDIKTFFAGMKPEKRMDGVYFCG